MWGDLKSLLEQQYVLAKKCNIGIPDTNQMAIFEMEIFVNLLMRDLEEEKKALEGN